VAVKEGIVYGAFDKYIYVYENGCLLRDGIELC